MIHQNDPYIARQLQRQIIAEHKHVLLDAELVEHVHHFGLETVIDARHIQYGHIVAILIPLAVDVGQCHCTHCRVHVARLVAQHDVHTAGLAGNAAGCSCGCDLWSFEKVLQLWEEERNGTETVLMSGGSP